MPTEHTRFSISQDRMAVARGNENISHVINVQLCRTPLCAASSQLARETFSLVCSLQMLSIDLILSLYINIYYVEDLCTVHIQCHVQYVTAVRGVAGDSSERCGW